MIATAAICTHNGNMVVNQNNLPFLLLLAGAAFLLASDRSDTGGARRLAYAALGGFMLGLAAMARLPLCLSLGLPVVAPVVRILCDRRSSWRAWTPVAAAWLGALAATGAGLAWLRSAGHLAAYVHSLSGADFAEGYAIRDLAALYASDAWRMLVLLGTLAAKLIPWAVGLHFMCSKAGYSRWAPGLFGAALLFWIAWTMRRHGIGAFHSEFFLLVPAIATAAGIGTLASALARRRGRESSPERQVLLGVALVLSLLIVAGTNNGLLNMAHGLWLVLPATILMLPIEFATRPEGSGGPSSPATLRYVASIAAVLAVTGVGVRFVTPYRDGRQRIHLTAPIDCGQLHGIRTSPSRAAAVGELCLQLRRCTKAGDPVLAYNSTPMVHYLTRTFPALGNPWPDLLSTNALKRRLAQMEQQGPAPVAVVCALTDMEERNWGTPRAVAFQGDALALGKSSLIQDTVRRMGYREVWANRDFMILRRPEAADAGRPGPAAPDPEGT